MKRQLEQKLLKRFSGLFKSTTLYCECSDGWYHILWRIFEQIEESLKKENKGFCDQLFIHQVKEKFGRLKIYMYGGNESINKIIQQAEADSRKVCELCGKPGKLRSIRGLLSTLCDGCCTKLQKRRNRL